MMDDPRLEKAIDNAIASMKIEGFTYSTKERALIRDFVLGNITSEEVILKLTKKNTTAEKRELNDCSSQA
jgi:hypothetical protein